MAKTPQTNPLLSKNIPQPPPQPPEETERENGITVTEQKGKTEERRPSMYATTDQDEERATIELSLYLKPSQDDKLEELKREYKRRTRKKISSNQIMRLLIDKATIDDLF